MNKHLDSEGLARVWEHARNMFARKEEVPHKVSDLDNDRGYLSEHQDISGKADRDHVHRTGDVTGLTNKLDELASKEHDHSIASIDGLDTALGNKADVHHTHTMGDVIGLNAELRDIRENMANKDDIRAEIGYEDVVDALGYQPAEMRTVEQNTRDIAMAAIDIANVKVRAQNNAGEISTLNAKDAVQNLKLTALENKANQVERMVGEVNGNVENVQEQVSGLLGEVSDINRTNAEQDLAIEEMQLKVDNATTLVEGLTERVDNIDEVVVEKVNPIERKLDALWKLNQGQVYDFEEKVESGMNDVPSGAKYLTLKDIRGKSDQESTTGKNLFPYRNRSIVQSGIHIDMAEGVMHVYGTCEKNALIYLDGKFGSSVPLFTLSAGNYYIGYECVLETPNRAKRLSGAFTLAEDTDICAINVRRFSSKEGDGAFVVGETYDIYYNVQLERGSAPTEWEPYTGGIASPNPQYPQAIHSVEAINVRIDGLNIERTITPPRPLNGIGTVHDSLVINAEGCKVIRRFGEVDMGTLSYRASDQYGYYANMPPDVNRSTKGNEMPNMMCELFSAKPWNDFFNGGRDKETFGITSNILGVSHTSSSIAEFTAIVSGNKIIYELAEPVETDIPALDIDLSMLTSDHNITVTDQDGNDVSYLLEYIVKLSEVV